MLSNNNNNNNDNDNNYKARRDLCQRIVSTGGGLEAPLSFKMTQCHVIVLEKVFVIGWRKEILWTRDGEGLRTRDFCGASKPSPSTNYGQQVIITRCL